MITRRCYGHFRINPNVIGITDCNEYFPVYVVFSHSMYRYNVNNYGESLSEQIVDDSYLYHKPYLLEKGRYADGSQYSDLFRFIDTIDVSSYTFKFEDEHHFLTCSKGYLADSDGNILMILCTKGFDIFTDDINQDVLNNNMTVLFISTELINNPIYKNVYKKLQSEYIQECHEKEVEVIYTTSKKIEERVYGNGFKVEFNSLTELDEHLKGDVGSNLFYVEEIMQPIIEDEIIIELEESEPEGIVETLSQSINEDIINTYNSYGEVTEAIIPSTTEEQPDLPF